jgi:Na+/H+ antiporter NhaD/arsenite permease-like protein
LALAVLGLTVVAFSAQGIFSEALGFEFGIHAISLSGAGLILALARPKEETLREGFLNDIVDKVEWQALLFFAGLFMLVGAIGELGYLTYVAQFVYNISGGNELALAITIIWVSAGASAVIDNIPFTAAMIPVIYGLGEAYAVNTTPLYWALAMGAGFGGNATPIGSSANVMTVAISERGSHPITTKEWAKVGLPVTIITCFVATIFMLLFHGTLYS